MARYDDEEEKWTARGIITGETPHRGITVIPPVASQRPPLPYGLKRPEQDIKGLTPEQVFPGYKPAMGFIKETFEMPTGRETRAWPSTFYSRKGEIAPTVTQDLSREVTDRVLDRTADYATRVEGRVKPQPTPVVTRPTLESTWGITQETLPTGATRYTLPGGEGTMTAEPETTETRLGDEAARRGVVSRIGTEAAERERGVETQLFNIERLREEGIQRQRYEEGTVERQRREDLGLEPKLGYAAYEESAKRMREGVIPPKERAAIEVARIGAISESEKARLTSEGVVSAAGMKSQTEAAKLGIQAADVKSKMQLRQAQMDKMLTETGLLEPMKLKLQGARDAVSRTKIQRDSYEAASKEIFDKRAKALGDQFGIGQIDLPTYDTKLDALVKSRAEQQDTIADTYAMEGQVHSTGVAVMRNGIWVDIPGKEKKE